MQEKQNTLLNGNTRCIANDLWRIFTACDE